ncbi:DUF927 domain-containing protein [uncultured Mailhella sp.]|uniref:DUF927 domain-containing protein n=1 Tax=uncultured Mailhella sp. TaxID=1981031 RepID=UPI0025E74313|nr:DUF927 domain-containing protein [uncultured Mailhella sp.]
MKTILDYALEYGQRGWAPIPLTAHTKEPCLRGWPNVASSDEAYIRQIFTHHNGNIGIVCGKKSSLLVIDVDMPDGPASLEQLESQLGKLPDTLSQTTGGGGKQFFFLYPAGVEIGNSVKKLGACIDIRANSGQVVVPPSIHPNGKQYKWDNNLSPAALPQAWIDYLVQLQKPTPARPAQPSELDETFGLHPYIDKALSNGMQKIANAEEGTRNTTLFKVVAGLAGFIPSGLLGENTLYDRAKQAFQDCHPDDMDEQEFSKTFSSAVEKGKQTPREIPDKFPAGFSIICTGDRAGLYYTEPAKKEGQLPTEIRLGAPLYVQGYIRDSASSNWGLLVEWNDPDNVLHREALSLEALSSNDSSAWKTPLAQGGWAIQGGKRGPEFVHCYLTSFEPSRRLLGVPCTGWHGDVFVLPEQILPDSKKGKVILLSPPRQNPYSQSGTLDEWKELIASHAKGNSRLILALCAACAGPLLHLLGQESGGFNFVGASSTGKTTALLMAASVWGKGAVSNGYILTWRGTDNGFETQAALHSDTLLCLDELSQAPSKVLYEASYMLGNGQGKQRATRTGAARDVRFWRTMILSTGEVGIAAKLAEEKRATRAGQVVRILDIPADAGADMGIFEELNGAASSRELADTLRKVTALYYGTAGPAFVNSIIPKLNDLLPTARMLLDASLNQLCTPADDGQVKRAAARFALCQTAGLLASISGVLPLSTDDITQGIKKCFDAWIAERGTTGALEDAQIVERTKQFLELHGPSRFVDLDSPEVAVGKTTNRAGFRQTKQGKTVYYILTNVFKNELCQGIPADRACKALMSAGLLIRQSNDRYTTKLPKEVSDVGRASVYAISIYDN